MQGISGCCRDCQERYPACHDTCEKYLSAKESWETKKQKIKESKKDPYWDYRAECIEREKRRGKYHGKRSCY